MTINSSEKQIAMGKMSKTMYSEKLQALIFHLRLRVIHLNSNNRIIVFTCSVMQRREAIRLFREICKCIPSMLVSSISLTPINRFKHDFELRINADLSDESLKDVEFIVKKHGMKLKEDKGTLLIFAVDSIEIAA
jgi:hypothetical protein